MAPVKQTRIRYACRLMGEIALRLLTVVFYKLKMMLGDKPFFAAMIVIPLCIMVATGYALRHEKLGRIAVAIVDEDCSAHSGTLLQSLAGKERLKVEHAEKRGKALKMLEGNEVEAVFIIKKGFGHKLDNGDIEDLIEVMQSPSSFSVEYVGEILAGEAFRLAARKWAVDRVLERYQALGIPAGENLAGEVAGYFDAQWEPGPLMTINYAEWAGTTAKEIDGIAPPAATAASAGIVVAFIMFYILYGSGWLIEERINGTLKRLVAGPGALGLSFAGSVLALAVSGMLQVFLFSAADRLLFGVDLFPGALSYMVFFVYILAVISLSLFLSSLLKTPAQMQAAAPVFALLTGFAGGCFWNFINMPENIEKLSMFTLQGWALKAANSLLAGPSGFGGIALPIAVLLFISLILMPISYMIILRYAKN